MPSEKAPLKVVEDFLHAYWSMDVEKAVALVTDDFHWINMPMPNSKVTVTSKEALRHKMSVSHGGFPEPIEDGGHVSGSSLTDGNVLMHERLDRMKLRGSWIEIPCNAVWTLRDGKIAEWKDYYDLGIYIRGMKAIGIEIDTSKWW